MTISEFDWETPETPEHWYNRLFERAKDKYNTETDCNKAVYLMAQLAIQLNDVYEQDEERHIRMRDNWLKVKELANV